LQKNDRQNVLIIKGLIFLLGFASFIFKIILSICVLIQISKSSTHATTANASSNANAHKKSETNSIPPINFMSPNYLLGGNKTTAAPADSNNLGNNPFRTPNKDYTNQNNNFV